MAAVPPPAFWLFLVASVGLFLASAKAHGRQLRLERELEGFQAVQFGLQSSKGSNPPWVEALWRRERMAFWVLFPSITLALGALAYLTAATPLCPAPTPSESGAALVVFSLVWGSSAAFSALGFASLARFYRRLRERREDVMKERADWRAASIRGSILWWVLVVVLALFALWVAYVGSATPIGANQACLPPLLF